MELNELEYKTVIGQGYFCVVKKYKNRDSNKNIAVKQLKSDYLNNEDYKHRFLREVRITKELYECNNIIDIVGEGREGEFWYAMPYAESNLYNYIRHNNTILILQDRLDIIDQVINAIKYAHNQGKLHRDLSPQNILLFISDGRVEVKVSDFGLGKDMESLSHLTRVEAEGYGQGFYVAPEQFEDLNSSSIQSDIYSLGKCIYFILTGKVPNIINQCELSVVINKSVKENPRDRYENMDELIQEYNNLKRLTLGVEINLENVTVSTYLQEKSIINWLEFHQVALRSVIIDHVFYDFLQPSIDLLLINNNLKSYYNVVGDSIKEFINILIANMNKCASCVKWPFSYTRTFGKILHLIYKEIDMDEVKIECLKNLWHLGLEQDQWSVLDRVKDIIQDGSIPESIVYTLAEYISRSSKKISIDSFYYKRIQEPIKIVLGI